MSAVRELLTKVVEFPVRSLGLRNIEFLTEQVQNRATTDMSVAKIFANRMRSGTVYDPPVVFHTPGDRYVMADGFHRAAAAKSLGKKSIDCVIREGTIEDAILFGIEANRALEVDRKPTEADKQKAVEIMLHNETFRVWCDSEISRRTGAAKRVVGKIRMKLKERDGIDFPLRVQAFSKSGLPLRVVPYKALAGVMRTTNDGVSIIRVAGRTHRMSKHQDVARETSTGKLSYFNGVKRSLINSSTFSSWLNSRLVPTESRRSRRSGGILVRGAIVIPIASLTHETALIAIGQATVIRAETTQHQRVIIVSYRDSLALSAGYFLNVVGSIPDPIEFMTPEEVVDEFGPKENPVDLQTGPLPLGL